MLRQRKKSGLIVVVGGILGVLILLNINDWLGTKPHPCYNNEPNSNGIDSSLGSESFTGEIGNLSLIESYSIDEILNPYTTVQEDNNLHRIKVDTYKDQLLVWAFGYKPILIDTSTNEIQELVLGTGKNELATGVSFLNVGAVYGFTNFESGSSLIWNLEEPQDRFQIPLAKREVVSGVYALPNSNCAIIRGSYSHIRFVDITTNIEQNRISIENPVSHFEVSLDGRYLAYATSGDNDSSGPIVVGVWDLATNQQILRYDSDFLVDDLAISPFGETITFLSKEKLYIQSVFEENGVPFIGETNPEPTSIDYYRDDIVISGDKAGNIRYWNSQTGNEIGINNIMQSNIIKILYNPYNGILITLNAEGYLNLWQ